MSFNSLLNAIGTIEKLTETQNSTTGQKKPSWAAFKTGVRGRLDQATGREYAAPNSIKARSTHVWFMKENYNLNEKSFRLNVNGKIYNILLVSDGGGHGHHQELLLERQV